MRYTWWKTGNYSPEWGKTLIKRNIEIKHDDQRIKEHKGTVLDHFIRKGPQPPICSLVPVARKCKQNHALQIPYMEPVN